MKIPEIPDTVFYSNIYSKSDIYAEYCVPEKAGGDKTIKKFVNINTPAFRSYLRLLVVPELKEDVSDVELAEKIVDTVNVYGNEDVVSVKVRTAGDLASGLVEYATHNERSEVIQVTAKGYTTTQDSKYKFVKYETSAAQVLPRNGNRNLFDIFKRYLNADSAEVKLFVIWLSQACCYGNHSLLLINAACGSGKSTLSKIIQEILDPSRLTAATMQGKSENLLTTLSNSYLVTFDNARDFSKDESDILCSAITGGTYSKRQLYTTNEMRVFELQNTIVINGVDVIPKESDLADRCLLLNLLPIPPEKRRTDGDILEDFEAELPEILGCIFNVLSKAVAIYPTLKPAKMPRMASAYKEMLAIAIALGMSAEEFDNIYYENLKKLSKARAKEDLFVAVREYMDKSVDGRSLEGTVSEVYSKIRNNYTGGKSSLPNSAAHFSRKLKSEYGTFLAAGYIINFDDTYADGTHIKIIKQKS